MSLSQYIFFVFLKNYLFKKKCTWRGFVLGRGKRDTDFYKLSSCRWRLSCFCVPNLFNKAVKSGY